MLCKGKEEWDLKGSHRPLSSNHLKNKQADISQQCGDIHFTQNRQEIFTSIQIPPIRKQKQKQKQLTIPTVMADSAQCAPDRGTSNEILATQLLERLPTIREL